IFFVSSRRRHTISKRDWSSDVCSSDLFVKRDRLQIIGVGHVLIAGVKLNEASRRIDRLVVAIALVITIGRHQNGAARPDRIGMRSEERRVGKEWRDREET